MDLGYLIGFQGLLSFSGTNCLGLVSSARGGADTITDGHGGLAPIVRFKMLDRKNIQEKRTISV